jgi:uncharacterized BrkB/YihY/UPF0761 family membrane protein
VYFEIACGISPVAKQDIRMIYFKSIVAGLLAVLAFAAALMIMIFSASAIWMWVHGGNVDLSIGIVTRSPSSWIAPFLIFGVAFSWKYRRLTS